MTYLRLLFIDPESVLTNENRSKSPRRGRRHAQVEARRPFFQSNPTRIEYAICMCLDWSDRCCDTAIWSLVFFVVKVIDIEILVSGSYSFKLRFIIFFFIIFRHLV